MNMFGIPMVGADICGFFGNEKMEKQEQSELCGRWHQLAVFYPLARNHYNKTKVEPHEAYNILPEYSEMAKKSMQQRMEYLRYMYTKLFESHKFGGTTIRPLFFEFPKDEMCHQDYEHTFMVGDALKVTPQLVSGKAPIKSYFPVGSSFIDLNDLSKEIVNSKGEFVELQPSNEFINVHLKAGKIIPWQEYADHEAITTSELLRAYVTLLLYPDQNGLADGTLYVDNDGVSLSDLTTGNYQYFNFRFSNQDGNTLQMHQVDGNAKDVRQSGNGVVDEIRVLGHENGYDKTNFACWFTKDLTPFDVKFQWKGDYLSLTPENGGIFEISRIHAV